MDDNDKKEILKHNHEKMTVSKEFINHLMKYVRMIRVRDPNTNESAYMIVGRG